MQPSAQPSSSPTAQPSTQPSRSPSSQPTSIPSGQPSSRPSLERELQVCVVFGVSFYGPRNITIDPLVRFAFQRALWVSAGIPYFNVEVALPDQASLCAGSVSTVNTGGFRRLVETGLEDDLAMDQLIESEQTQRRQQIFGISDFSALRSAAFAELYQSSLRGSGKDTLAIIPGAPDTNVFFSLVSNVPPPLNTSLPRANPLVQKLITSVVTQVNSGKFSVDLVYAAQQYRAMPLLQDGTFQDIHLIRNPDVVVGSFVYVDAPTSYPTSSPPTPRPTKSPVTAKPTNVGDTNPPTSYPSTSQPTSVPSGIPTGQPTSEPTGQPTSNPTSPTSMPSSSPTFYGE